MAVVVSPREYERLNGKHVSFGDAYTRFLTTHSLQEVGLDKDFAATVRDPSVGRHTGF